MKFTSVVSSLVFASTAPAFSVAFTTQQPLIGKSSSIRSDSSTSLNLSNDWKEQISKTLATTALVTGALWSFNPSVLPSDHFMHSHMMANAKEMASGSGTRVNKDPESLLRYGLPLKSKEVRKVQVDIETIKYDLGSRRKAAAADGVKTVRRLLSGKEADKLAAACRDPKMCSPIIQQMAAELDPLSIAIQDSMNAFQGSVQERSALDKANASQQKVSKLLTQLEEAMVPAGYSVEVPSDYDTLPQLQTGRAKVVMTVKKPADQKFVVEGISYDEANLVMIVDGYTTPVTSGNFVDLVEKGFYNNMEIQRSDGFVVQTGDPSGPAVGYVPESGTPVWEKGDKGERNIPLEIFVQGDKAPLYESTIEDDGRGGQATILPFSSYGAMGWARNDYEANSGSSQFFWLLFDSDLTPAGKNVLDGTYPCFGYVVEGADFLAEMKEGDVIVSAKVVEGIDNMKKT